MRSFSCNGSSPCHGRGVTAARRSATGARGPARRVRSKAGRFRVPTREGGCRPQASRSGLGAKVGRLSTHMARLGTRSGKGRDGAPGELCRAELQHWAILPCGLSPYLLDSSRVVFSQRTGRGERVSDRCGRIGAWSPGAKAAVATSLVMEVLARDGEAWVREATLSMSPLIRPGDEVCLVRPDPGHINRGALIACQRAEGLVLHRVLARTDAGVVTKGDALASPDPPVGWGQVVAGVAALRRAGKPEADLKVFPWPQINHALGVVAAIACRIPVENGAGGARTFLTRLAWKFLRLPFYLARCLVP